MGECCIEVPFVGVHSTRTAGLGDAIGRVRCLPELAGAFTPIQFDPQMIDSRKVDLGVPRERQMRAACPATSVLAAVRFTHNGSTYGGRCLPFPLGDRLLCNDGPSTGLSRHRPLETP
jgi:hypothetical protein